MANMLPMEKHRLQIAIERSERTYRDVAGELGVSAGYLHDLAHGRRTPSLETAFAIERVLGVPAAIWASRSDPTPTADTAA